MDKIRTFALVLGLAAASSPAASESYETSFAQTGSGESATAFVSYNSSCGEECHVADLSCSADSDVRFSKTGFGPKVAAAMIKDDKVKFVVMIGGTTFDFYLSKFEYEGEMTGDWSAEGALLGEAKPFLAALSKAKSYKAVVGSQAITLPVTKDVLSWTAACAK